MEKGVGRSCVIYIESCDKMYLIGLCKIQGDQKENKKKNEEEKRRGNWQQQKKPAWKIDSCTNKVLDPHIASTNVKMRAIEG